MILLAGGEADPNLRALEATLGRLRISCRAIYFGGTQHPSIHWEIGSPRLLIDGKPLKVSGAFVRYDVFNQMADGRPASAFRAGAWYTAITAWLACHPQLRRLNARLDPELSKPYVLHLAQELGMRIPATAISNDLAAMKRWTARADLIVKPINGGEYCQDLGAVLRRTSTRRGRTAAPAIVQAKLVAPDLRIYLIGPELLAFKIESPHLDYRMAEDCAIEALPKPPPLLGSQLRKLGRRLRMNFLAADFKQCPESGEYLFLEVNSSPMFAGFDRVAGGRLTEAMSAQLA